MIFAVFLIASLCILAKNSTQHYRIFTEPEHGISDDGTYKTSSLELSKGTYRIVLCYAATDDTKVSIIKGFEESESYTLSAGDGQYLEVFTDIPVSTDLFSINVSDSEAHGFELYNYEIETEGTFNNDYTFIAVLTLLAGIGLSYLFYRYYGTASAGSLITPAVITGLVMVTSYPVFRDYIVYGHDLGFHLMRLTGVTDSLRGGHIIPVIYPESNNGFGTMGLLYPQLFLYPLALLRLCDISTAAVWNFALLLVNIMTAVICFLSIRSVCQDLKDKGYTKNLYYAQILGVTVYMLSPYRLTNMYIRASFGEMVAMAILPMFIAGMYHILCGSVKKWYMLAISATLILHDHVLSVAMYAILAVVLTVFAIVYVIKNEPLKRLKYLVICTAAVVAANIWFIIPFIRMYTSGIDLKFVHQPLFYRYSVFPAQLFMTASSDFVAQTVAEGIGNEMGQSIGLVGGLCALLVTAAIILLIFGKASKEEKGCAGSFLMPLFAAFIIFTFMSLTIFPWEYLSKIGPVTSLMGTIQFPYRFLGISSAVLAFAVTFAVIEYPEVFGYKRELALLILILGLIGCIPITDGALKKEIYAASVNGGYSRIKLPEYWPEGTDEALFSDPERALPSGEVTDYAKDFSGVSFNVSADEDIFVDVPLLYYRGYKAKCNDTYLEIQRSDDNRIRVSIPSGTNGTVKVYYSYGSILF